MSITDKMRQLNPRVESKVAPIDKIQTFFTEEVKLPSEILDGFTHEINTKKSSSKRTAKWI